MKHLRSMGAPALRHSQVAAERWEERELGIPIMHFVHGVDFGAPNTPTSGDDFAGAVCHQHVVGVCYFWHSQVDWICFCHKER